MESRVTALELEAEGGGGEVLGGWDEAFPEWMVLARAGVVMMLMDRGIPTWAWGGSGEPGDPSVSIPLKAGKGLLMLLVTCDLWASPPPPPPPPPPFSLSPCGPRPSPWVTKTLLIPKESFGRAGGDVEGGGEEEQGE